MNIHENKIENTTIGITGWHDGSTIDDNEIIGDAALFTGSAIAGQLQNTAITNNDISDYETGSALVLLSYLDRPNSTNLTVTGNSFTNNLVAIVIGHSTTGLFADLADNTTSTIPGGYFLAQGGGDTLDLTLASNPTFTGNTVNGINIHSPSVTDQFALEDTILHKIDGTTPSLLVSSLIPSVGLVLLIPDTLYVTANSYSSLFLDTTTPSIQRAINAAGSNYTVHVGPGTFIEDVSANKTGLKLIGSGVASTTLKGAIGGPSGSTIAVAANNVEISNFHITRDGNNPANWYNAGLNSAGISVQGQTILNLLVHDNLITGNRTGIDVNNSNGHTIRNNVITDNRTGLIFRNQTDNLMVEENYITDNWTVGILFLDASSGSNVPEQQALGSIFQNNDISGNWYGQIVDRQTGGSLPAPGVETKNFVGNWYGTATPWISTANSAEPGYGTIVDGLTLIPVGYGGTQVPPAPRSRTFSARPRATLWWCLGCTWAQTQTSRPNSAAEPMASRG